MIFRLIAFLTRRFLPLRRPVVRWWYQYLSRRSRDADWSFMNFGFVELGSENSRLELDPSLETERYPLQLYHHVASAADLTGKDVLEVGSGRGGGLAYIHNYFMPRSSTGVDISANAVSFCNQVHAHNGLSFRVGDAEALPFEDASFDAVINVESSHCYGSMESFLDEVARVLRPGGVFLFADFRHDQVVDVLPRQLEEASFELLSVRDISPNVIRALEIDAERWRALIRKEAPRFMAGILKQFAGQEGSKIWTGLTSGTSRYFSAVMQKPLD